MSTRRILVTGATGQQGRSVISCLLSRPPPFPHTILALTRDPTSKKALDLAKENPNVELIGGDLEDCDKVFEGLGGIDRVWAVFLVTVPDMNAPKKKERKKVEGEGEGEGVADEERSKEEVQGCNMVDAAVKYGVEKIVFSSVERGGDVKSDTNPTDVPHFISKHNIEVYLRWRAQEATESGKTFEYTILRPVAFMENMQPGFFCKMFNAMWLGMGPDTKLQLVSTRDIAVFAALAFGGSREERLKNQAISLAGDELTQPQANEVFWSVYGRPVPRTYVFWGTLLQRMVSEVGIMFRFFKEQGYGADIEECRRLNPDMIDLETWLRTESQHLR